jgi:6-phosphogluconolactonase/glucosamine-6-phosphate isomerase/deaminase
MLDKHFFLPLEIPESNICFFDGKANDPEAECRRAGSFILAHGPIDLAVLGLGMNGHIGFNEPGTSPSLHAHVVNLDKVTTQVGQKYFPGQRLLAKGITLGLADLTEADKLLLIVNGEQKAPVVRRMLKQEAGDHLPASLLRDHPGLSIYLDQAAASLL